MKRGVLLSAFWSVLLILFLPRFVGGIPPPDCEDCACAEADAWILVEGDNEYGPTVLKNQAGVVVTLGITRQTKDGKVTSGVEAPVCLKNNAEVEPTATHKLFEYKDVTWELTCKAKKTNLKYWLATKYNKDWTTTDKGTDFNRMTCGKQD
jgi:hypothetical protein